MNSKLLLFVIVGLIASSFYVGNAFAEESGITYDVFDNPPKFFGDNMIIASPGKSIDGVLNAGTLIFSLENSEQGQIILELPKNNQECAEGNPEWYVLIDGIESKYEIVNENKSLIFTVNIPPNTEIIEILNTVMIRLMPTGCLIIE